MVTAGTYEKAHLFASKKRLRYLHQTLLDLAIQYEWRLEAWAVFSNHYHLVAVSPEGSAESLPLLIRDLHKETAKFVNGLDETPGRKVWHNYRDTF